MAHSKPAFVLLHGSWHTPKCWSKLTPLLEEKGHKVVAPQLPSTGSNPPISSWDPDLEVIRSTVEEMAKEQDVVLVMHSFSGMTGGTAIEGLDKKSCQEKGWKGGVIRLIYIVAFMVMEGFQMCPDGSTATLDPDIVIDQEAGTYSVPAERVKGLMYQDVSDEEALEVAGTLVPQSLGPVWSKTSFAAWRWIPTTFVIALKDKPTTVTAAEWLVKSAVENQPNEVEKVIKREVGHSPMWTQPEWTAQMLVEEAGN